MELEKERTKQRILREKEETRLKREMAERERQRAQQEHENIRKKEAEKRIEQLKTTDIGIRALEGLTEEVSHLASWIWYGKAWSLVDCAGHIIPVAVFISCYITI